MISACLSQGEFHILHPHVKSPSHLGLASRPYCLSTPQTKAGPPHHYSWPLKSSVKQGYPSSVQTPDPIHTSTLWLTGDLRICSSTSRVPISLPSPVPTSSLSLPSIRKFTHTQRSSFHHLIFLLFAAIS